MGKEVKMGEFVTMRKNVFQFPIWVRKLFGYFCADDFTVAVSIPYMGKVVVINNKNMNISAEFRFNSLYG